MIYGNDTISHYNKSNIFVWMLMAFQAGCLNIGGFLACHRFVSHITGFATFFASEVVLAEYERAFGMLLVPISFLIGAMCSGFFVDFQLRHFKFPRYFLSFGLIFVIIVLVFLLGHSGYFGEFGVLVEDKSDYFLLFLLCFVCGLQNGTITTVSKSVIRTTHLTGLTTDLGIGLTRLILNGNKNENFENEKKAIFMRLGIISFFGIGSLVGAFLYTKWNYDGFVLPVLTSGILFLMMIFVQLKHKLKKN